MLTKEFLKPTEEESTSRKCTELSNALLRSRYMTLADILSYAAYKEGILIGTNVPAESILLEYTQRIQHDILCELNSQLNYKPFLE